MDMMSLRRRVLVNQNKLMTATGNPITFNTPLTKPLKECVVSFAPQQEGSGTPSPDNVREIVGKNGITVRQSGKNLCPELSDENYWSIKGYFDSPGTIVLNSGYRACDLKPVRPNADYTLSTYGTGWKGIGFYDDGHNIVGYKQANAVTVSLKSPSNARYYRIYSVYSANANNIQLEIGTTATEYEAYAPVETSVSFPAVGKNLLDSTKRKDGYYIDNTGKEIANTNFGYTTAYTPVEPNETYVLSGNIGNASSANGAIYCYDENKNFVNRLGGWKTTKVPHTFTVPSDTYYINIQYYKTLTNVQIEKGSTATAYEPFDNTVYGGYVDMVKGELVAEYYKVPSSAFVKARQNNGYIAYYYRAPDFESGIPWLCNLIGEYGSFSTSNMTKNIIQSSRVGGATYLALDETVDINTLEIVYPLAEPIHYSLTPQSIATLRGNNVMWSDANGDIAVKYWTR